MTEQHRQSPEDEHPRPAPATQPGDPGAASQSRPRAAPGIHIGMDLAVGPSTTIYGGILGVTAEHPAMVEGLVMQEIERRILAMERSIDGMIEHGRILNETIAEHNKILAKLVSMGSA